MSFLANRHAILNFIQLEQLSIRKLKDKLCPAASNNNKNVVFRFSHKFR